MLAIAAARALRRVAAESATRGLPRASRATYQTYAEHGRQLHARASWPSRLLAYLRYGIDAVTGAAAKRPSLRHAFSGTAAERLQAALPRGPGWLRGLQGRASAAAQRTAAGCGHNGRLVWKLVAPLHGLAGAPRAAARLVGYRPWAFERGGRWSPYAATLAQAFRAQSVQQAANPAQTVAAHFRRLAVAGIVAQQQHRGLAIALPQSHGARRGLGATRQSSTGGRVSAKSSAASFASHASEGPPRQPMAREAGVPVEQWATITVPLAPPTAAAAAAAAGHHPLDARASLADAARQLAGIHGAQSRHAMLLSRLLERLLATGWGVQCRQTGRHAECLEIALPPASGIYTAGDLEALLGEWGLDASMLAAVFSAPSRAHSRAPSGRSASAELSAGSSELGDLDSRLFSLIVDEIVDPEEAYREQVREFLADLERIPRLSMANGPVQTPQYLFL
ncbi:hypothetical protein LPJ61_000221 [Coemansia biformis]|uniref:Uncharacterized protein n=1 Tax=Coemansia biformis TaxID=1286918 RepID=A0A9W8CZ78_9FUNG|nr:hypothetical protein LPJ61_000221 [Coemansia biformis]